MKKNILVFVCSVLLICLVQAQTKVFRQVNSEISSAMYPIIQDEGLVGYLAFARLEKVNADTFNYQVTIMDENLNDIGKIDFKEESLQLQSVSFENDILCLAYLKSNIIGKNFSKYKDFQAQLPLMKNYFFIQFLNLEGKITATHQTPVDVHVPTSLYNGTEAVGNFTNYTQLANIPGKGFAAFFADRKERFLQIYNTEGKLLWTKTPGTAHNNELFTTSEHVYILQTNIHGAERGSSMLTYGIEDKKEKPKFDFTDKQGNKLKILNIAKDPISGKLYASGNILNNKYGRIVNGKKIKKGIYKGVFTINFDGSARKDIKAIYSYWDDGSQASAISKKGGLVTDNKNVFYYKAIKDTEGNTNFIGAPFKTKFKTGNLVFSIIAIPLIIYTPIILSSGLTECSVNETAVIKQSSDGKLSVDNVVSQNNKVYLFSSQSIENLPKGYTMVTNSHKKNNYVIITDRKEIAIYNINTKKIERTIPVVDKQVVTKVFPAKEGYILVSEYNKKEKTVRYSIESL